MNDRRKTKEQLIRELEEFRQDAGSADGRSGQAGQKDWLPAMHASALHIINGCPAVICGIDVDGTTRFVNPAAEEVTGYTSRELVGKNWWTIFYSGEEYRQVEQLLRDLEREDVRDYEMVLARKDGQRRRISWNAVNRRDRQGRIVQIIGFGIDVTERNRAEEGLQRFRAALDRSADAIYLIDYRTMRFADVNDTACRSVGYSRDELLRMGPHDLDVRLSVEQLAEVHEKTIVSNQASVIETFHRRKDGSVFPVEVVLRWLESDGQKLVVASVRDITARRAAEENVRKERQLLRRLLDVQERDRKLVAYEIHDGFVQQVTAALLHFQACQQQTECTARMNEEFLQGLRLLRQSIDEARQLISGLRPPILDESGLVAAIDYLACEGQAAEGIAIEFTHRGELEGLASPLQGTLFRIVQEAMANACRHSRTERIRVELARQDGWVRIEVQDWGVGFDPDRVEENRFGLESIRERARLLGGHATIESAPGCGTRVIVELPILETDSAPR